MATDLEKLVVSLEANIKGFEREMKKAAGVVKSTRSDMERETQSLSGSLDRQFEKAGEGFSKAFRRSLGLNIRGGLTAVLVEAGFEQVRAAFKEIADLGRDAKTIGINPNELQAFQSGAIEKRSTAEAMTTALKGLSKAANDATRDENKFSKILAANGVSLKDNEGKLRSTKDLLYDYSDLVARAGTEQDKLVLLKAIGADDSLAAYFSRGSGALRELQKEELAAGNLLNTEMIQKATELDAAFESLWHDFKTYSTSAIVDTLRQLGNLMQGVKDFFDSQSAKAAAGMRILNSDKPDGVDPGVKPDTSSASPFGSIGTYSFGKTKSAGSEKAALDELNKKLGGGKETVIPPRKSGGGGAGAAEKANEYDLEEKRMQRSIRDLGAQAQAIGKTTFEAAKAEAQFRLLDAAQQAGLPVTAELTANVDKLATAYANAKAKLAETQLAQQQFVELQGFVGSSLIDVTKGAMHGMDGLRSAIQRVTEALMDAALQAIILGKGPLAGLFGTGTTSNGGVGGIIGALFRNMGGAGAGAVGAPMNIVPLGFADGGMVPGMTGQAVPVIAHAGEVILNAAQQKAVAAGINNRGGGKPLSLHYNIDARGAQIGVAEQITRAIRDNNNRLPSLMRDVQKRAG